MADSEKKTKGSNVRSMEFIECEQMMELVRGGNGEFIQAAKGVCLGSMRQIHLDGIQILSADLSNKTIVNAAADPGIDVIHLPLRWTGEMRWNGRQIERPTGIVWGENPEWSRLASDSLVVTLGIQREVLFSGLAKWTGGTPEASWRFKGHILNPTRQTRHLLKMVWEVVELSKRSPDVFDLPQTARVIRDSLLCNLFAATAVDNGIATEMVSLNRRSRALIKVNEFLREHEHRNITLLDLCAVSGVSARTLEYAFKEYFGITPIPYLRIRRLKRARSLLQRAHPASTNVTACALHAGFTHLGRFSVDYRSFFGESPSTTLARPFG